MTPDVLFRRNHFPYPPRALNLLLTVDGHVHEPVSLRFEELSRMPSKRLDVVLECSGNRRSGFRPKVFGEQWEEGAISRGVWTGVPLAALLQRTGIRQGAAEVVFTGNDRGEREDRSGVFPFARSLPLAKALHPDTLIAYAYNGRPIPYAHGYPLRLIVPGWYAMASVKWLSRITVLDHPFRGPFQTVDYVYYPEKESEVGSRLVTSINVNSTILQPLDYSVVKMGRHLVKGIAWTGEGWIDRVEFSPDGGRNWEPIRCHADPSARYGWTVWEYVWTAAAPGEYTLLARAADSAGRVQPAEPFWNRKGYGYNAVSAVRVKVEAAP